MRGFRFRSSDPRDTCRPEADETKLPVAHEKKKPWYPGQQDIGLHNFCSRGRFICLVCSDQSRKEYNLSSNSKYILIVLG